ncbi:MAG: hypothetical protein M3N16_00250 [Actinomycetota bacterium]|nr:hypothetical protein [Actinomycetota bacterium]
MASPDNSLQGVFDQSNALIREERYAENERLLRSTLSRFPNDPELNLRLGSALLTRPPDAKRYIKRAIELSPFDPRLLTVAASHMFFLGEYDTASEYVRRASKVVPDGFPLAADLVHLIGKLAMQKGNDAVAERYLVLAFEEEPETSGHGQALAEFYASQGRSTEALRVARTAVRLRPDDESLLQLVDELSTRSARA